MQLTPPPELLSGKRINWESSATSIASVSSSGLVTGLSPGRAQITAKVQRNSAKYVVMVEAAETPPAVTTIGITPATAELQVHGTAQLVAEARDQNGNVMPGTTFSWQSANTGVATVSASGVVSAVAAGIASITASSGGKTGTATVTVRPVPGTPASKGCTDPAPEWIWCDDFEQDRLGSYFEYSDAGGSFTRVAGVGRDASYGMRVRWAVGQVEAGFLHLAFGRTPQAYFDPVDAGTANYREIYWRMYVRHEPGWTGGGGDKLSRATIFASPTSWAQAMIAHVWAGSSPNQNYLVIDPASGTDAVGNLVATRYNDFGNLRWLGGVLGKTPLFAANRVGEWHCVEARARLNDPGAANGVFELWVNGELDAQKTGLNWVGAYNAYGINAVFVENYWNAGSPQAQERYLDGFVVSTAPIGCGDASPPRQDIARLRVDAAADTLNAIGHSVRLTATAYDTNGDLVTSPSIGWSSLNPGIATVDATGNVVARATGTALIVATAACCAGAADSSRIEVHQVTASVAVAPASAILAVGDTLRLTATALDSAGVMIPGKTFAWTSSNTAAATVDGTGLVRAVSADTASIIATTDERSGRSFVRVGSGGGAVRHPNEPAGFVRFAEYSFEFLVPSGPPGICSWPGVIDGCGFRYDPHGNYSTLSLSDAPASASGVMQIRFPAGHPGSSSPGLFQGWNTPSETNSTQYRAVYESGWIRVPTPGFEMHPVGVKFLGYVGVAQAGQDRVPAQIYFVAFNPGGQSIQSAATISVVQQAVADRAMHQNVTTGPVFTFGEWHHYEYLMVINDIGVANGRLKVWWDGVLILDYDDVTWRNDANPSGFYGRRWDPIWGGAGGVAKTRDDYLQIDHLYISGIPF